MLQRNNGADRHIKELGGAMRQICGIGQRKFTGEKFTLRKGCGCSMI